MLPVLEWFRTRFRRKASHLLYVPIETKNVRHTDGAAASSTVLLAGQHYFRLWLVQMFLANDRNWFTEWHPAVPSSITFSFGSNTEVLTGLSGQSKLKDLNSGNLGKFLTINQQLTGLLPFNGGTVTVDAGVLAMKGKDDLKDLIKSVGDIGSLLAVPQLSAAMAVAGPLANAIGSLVGATDGELMVGLNQTYSEAGGGADAILRAGYYAVLDATAETFPDKAKFWVEQDSLQYGDTLEGSKPLQAVNYMLFRIECRDNRNDWDELRSISDPYKEVLKSLQAGQVEAAQVHLKSAIQAALTAPELTKNVDRRRVVEQLKL